MALVGATGGKEFAGQAPHALLRGLRPAASNSTAAPSPTTRWSGCGGRSAGSPRTCSCSRARCAKPGLWTSGAGFDALVAAARAADAPSRACRRLRHAGGRARCEAQRWATPAPIHRAGPAQGSAHPPARRGHQRGGQRDRSGDPAFPCAASRISARSSSLPIACRPSCMRTASWYWTRGASSKPARMPNCSRGAAPMRRCGACRQTGGTAAGDGALRAAASAPS